MPEPRDTVLWVLKCECVEARAEAGLERNVECMQVFSNIMWPTSLMGCPTSCTKRLVNAIAECSKSRERLSNSTGQRIQLHERAKSIITWNLINLLSLRRRRCTQGTVQSHTDDPTFSDIARSVQILCKTFPVYNFTLPSQRGFVSFYRNILKGQTPHPSKDRSWSVINILGKSCLLSWEFSQRISMRSGDRTQEERDQSYLRHLHGFVRCFVVVSGAFLDGKCFVSVVTLRGLASMKILLHFHLVEARHSRLFSLNRAFDYFSQRRGFDMDRDRFIYSGGSTHRVISIDSV